ncbi:hypothetical protein [Streptomyces bobili]|uniref:hypothetical protein n=1 Tax=Streptomyces bobili TaxID=67280 RepID=UPI003F540CA3
MVRDFGGAVRLPPFCCRRPGNLGFVRELGADEALSYTTTRTSDLSAFDVVLDTVGTQHPAHRRLLSPGRRMIAESPQACSRR